MDTLARCSGDGDEDSTKDMNAFVRGCDWLKAAFPNCTVLVLHHCGWEGTRSRGARSWVGALDTNIRIHRKTDDLVELTVTRQKDFDRPKDAVMVELYDVPGTNGVVLRLADASKVKAAKEGNDELLLGLLLAAGDKGLSVSEMEQKTKINGNTLRTVRQRLKRRSLATQKQKRWFSSHTFELPENDDVTAVRAL